MKRVYSQAWKAGVCPKGLIYLLTFFLPRKWVDFEIGKESLHDGAEGYEVLVHYTWNSFYITKVRAYKSEGRG